MTWAEYSAGIAREAHATWRLMCKRCPACGSSGRWCGFCHAEPSGGDLTKVREWQRRWTEQFDAEMAARDADMAERDRYDF